MLTASPIKPRIGCGVYTLPDAALILRLPLTRLHSWVGSYIASLNDAVPILQSWGDGHSRGFNFFVLVEAYTVFSLRNLGASLQRIRSAREVLAEHLDTPYPFAAQGILGSRGKVFFDLQGSNPQALLHLDRGKQLEFGAIIESFCTRIDFNNATLLAERFWPLGHNSSIVVDPRHAFGRPVISGTNITAEALSDLLDAGEASSDVASQYNIPVSAVKEAHAFMHQLAA